MIESKELRIGNLFLERFTKEVLIVEELTVDKITFSGDYSTEWQAEPIPLTEEWLVKFGYNNNQVYIRDLKVTTTEDNEPIYYLADEYDNGVGCNDIEYVHQLQNLYFALTGEELKIK